MDKTIMKRTEHSVLLNKGYPQEKLLYKSLKYLGFIRA